MVTLFPKHNNQVNTNTNDVVKDKDDGYAYNRNDVSPSSLIPPPLPPLVAASPPPFPSLSKQQKGSSFRPTRQTSTPDHILSLPRNNSLPSPPRFTSNNNNTTTAFFPRLRSEARCPPPHPSTALASSSSPLSPLLLLQSSSSLPSSSTSSSSSTPEVPKVPIASPLYSYSSSSLLAVSSTEGISISTADSPHRTIANIRHATGGASASSGSEGTIQCLSFRPIDPSLSSQSSSSSNNQNIRWLATSSGSAVLIFQFHHLSQQYRNYHNNRDQQQYQQGGNRSGGEQQKSSPPRILGRLPASAGRRDTVSALAWKKNNYTNNNNNNYNDSNNHDSGMFSTFSGGLSLVTAAGNDIGLWDLRNWNLRMRPKFRLPRDFSSMSSNCSNGGICALEWIGNDVAVLGNNGIFRIYDEERGADNGFETICFAAHSKVALGLTFVTTTTTTTTTTTANNNNNNNNNNDIRDRDNHSTHDDDENNHRRRNGNTSSSSSSSSTSRIVKRRRNTWITWGMDCDDDERIKSKNSYCTVRVWKEIEQQQGKKVTVSDRVSKNDGQVHGERVRTEMDINDIRTKDRKREANSDRIMEDVNYSDNKNDDGTNAVDNNNHDHSTTMDGINQQQKEEGRRYTCAAQVMVPGFMCARAVPEPFTDAFITLRENRDDGGWITELWKIIHNGDDNDNDGSVPSPSSRSSCFGLRNIASFSGGRTRRPMISTSTSFVSSSSWGTVAGEPLVAADLAVVPSQSDKNSERRKGDAGGTGSGASNNKSSSSTLISTYPQVPPLSSVELVLCCLGSGGYLTTHVIPEAVDMLPCRNDNLNDSTINNTLSCLQPNNMTTSTVTGAGGGLYTTNLPSLEGGHNHHSNRHTTTFHRQQKRGRARSRGMSLDVEPNPSFQHGLGSGNSDNANGYDDRMMASANAAAMAASSGGRAPRLHGHKSSSFSKGIDFDLLNQEDRWCHPDSPLQKQLGLDGGVDDCTGVGGMGGSSIANGNGNSSDGGEREEKSDILLDTTLRKRLYPDRHEDDDSVNAILSPSGGNRGKLGGVKDDEDSSGGGGGDNRGGETATATVPSDNFRAIDPSVAVRVPFPRPCGARFRAGGGGGGLVSFRNGAVSKAFLWFGEMVESRTTASEVRMATTSSIFPEPRLEGDQILVINKGAPEKNSSSLTRTEVVDGESDVAMTTMTTEAIEITQLKVTPAVGGKWPKTLWDLMRMKEAVSARQWQSLNENHVNEDEECQSDTEEGGNISDKSDDDDDDDDDDSSCSTVSERRQDDIYKRYFGSHGPLPSVSKDGYLFADSTSDGKEGEESKGSFWGKSRGIDRLAPVVVFTQSHDDTILDGQCPELADSWTLGPWTNEDFNKEEEPDEGELCKFPDSSDSFNDGSESNHSINYEDNNFHRSTYRARTKSFEGEVDSEITNTMRRNKSSIELNNILDEEGLSDFSYIMNPLSTSVIPPDHQNICNTEEHYQDKSKSIKSRKILGPKTIAPSAFMDVIGGVHKQLTRIHNICNQNAEASKSLEQTGKADTWTLLALIAKNICLGERDDFDGWGEIGTGALACDIIQNIITYYEGRGDVQMLATIICVFGGCRDRNYRNHQKDTDYSASLSHEPSSILECLFPDKNKRFDLHIHRYGVLLFGWGKLCLFAELNKHLADTSSADPGRHFANLRGSPLVQERVGNGSYNDRLSMSPNFGREAGIGFAPWCTRCRYPANQVTNVCSYCQNYAFCCSICTNAVRGLFTVCITCGHGGHVEHIIPWFENNTVCPSGCGCSCTLNMFSSIKVDNSQNIPDSIYQPFSIKVVSSPAVSSRRVFGPNLRTSRILKKRVRSSEEKEIFGIPFGSYCLPCN